MLSGAEGVSALLMSATQPSLTVQQFFCHGMRGGRRSPFSAVELARRRAPLSLALARTSHPAPLLTDELPRAIHSRWGLPKDLMPCLISVSAHGRSRQPRRGMTDHA